MNDEPMMFSCWYAKEHYAKHTSTVAGLCWSLFGGQEVLVAFGQVIHNTIPAINFW